MGNHWHPNGAGVLLATMDGTLDLSDITWQEVAPCGCVCGLTVAATDDLIVTAEQAGRDFASSDADYKQSVARGFTWRPREHHAACAEMKGRAACPHTPTYGYEKPPTPDGMTWAVGGWHGSVTRTTHLVPEKAIDRTDYGGGDQPSLCGAAKKFQWRNHHATDGKVECSKCIAAAQKQAVSA